MRGSYLPWTAISSHRQHHFVENQRNKIKTGDKQNTHYKVWKGQHVMTSVLVQKYVSHLGQVHLLPMRACINWTRLHSHHHKTFHIGCPHSERLHMVVLHISKDHTGRRYLLNISNLTHIDRLIDKI